MAEEEGTLDVLRKIGEFAKEILTTEEINNKLLLATVVEGKTFYMTAKRGRLEIL